MGANPTDVLNVARREIGYSRWSDPQTGSKYGRWYAEQVGAPYYAASGVPFCAMGVSWTFAHADAMSAMVDILPSAYCPEMVSRARSAGMAVSKASAQPGDVLMFDWEANGESDHTGFCEINYPGSSYMQTVEYNTNNGQVARRARAYSTICQVIRPRWGGTISKPSEPVTPPDQIEVDGLWGSDTNKKLQAALGTFVDGIIDSQPTTNYSILADCCRIGWEWVSPSVAEGSPCIVALQRKIGADPDGFCGPNTVSALQTAMGTYVDGRLDEGSPCVAEMQRRLNAGTF